MVRHERQDQSRYQERLNKAGSAATNLKDLAPNIAERIDMLRATGNEQLLRDLGVIYTENGIDKVDMEVFHERIGMFMDDPNNPALRGMNPSDKTQFLGRRTGVVVVVRHGRNQVFQFTDGFQITQPAQIDTVDPDSIEFLTELTDESVHFGCDQCVGLEEGDQSSTVGSGDTGSMAGRISYCSFCAFCNSA
ncbi:hypothetical protein AP1_0464 [Aeromonas phage AP1]|nr:hypothetical protein AP1_0464 [Aeromonas phage AP1]